MKIINHKLRIVIVSLVIALPLFGATQVVAQEQEFTPEAYTSELTGYEVEVSGPEFAITDVVLEQYANGEGEIVTIESDLASVEVSFFDDEDTPEESIDAYLAGIGQSDLEFTEVDRGVDGDVTYAIILIHYEGVDVLYYMHVSEDVTGNVDLFETLLTLPDTLEVDIASAQDEITIDGFPFMDTADANEILAAIDGAGSGEDVSSPEATTQTATPEIKVPIEIANAELGLSGDFDVVADPIMEGSIEGHAVAGNDIKALVAVGETGMTPDETVTSFSEGLTGSFHDAELVDSVDEGDTAWALYAAEINGEQRVLLVVADTTTVPGFETLVGLEMPRVNVSGSIELVQNNLSIDGQPLLTNVDADEIDALIGEVELETVIDIDTTPEATEATEDVDEGSDADDPREDAKLPTDAGSENTSETNTSETETTPEATEEPRG